MRILMCVLALLLSSCTISTHVRDVYRQQDGQVVVERCDLKVYLALYGLIAGDHNCTKQTI